MSSFRHARNIRRVAVVGLASSLVVSGLTVGSAQSAQGVWLAGPSVIQGHDDGQPSDAEIRRMRQTKKENAARAAQQRREQKEQDEARERQALREQMARDHLYEWLGQKGLACAGNECRPAEGATLPEILDFGHMDLKGITFKDISVEFLRTNNATLTDVIFENLNVSRSWDAYQMKATRLEVKGQVKADGTKAVLNGDWEGVQPNKITISNMELNSWSLKETKGSPARYESITVTDSTISRIAADSLVSAGVKEFPSNKFIDFQANANPKVVERINFENSRFEGDVSNVKFKDCNLNGISAGSLPGEVGANWKSVYVEGGKFNNVDLALRNGTNIGIDVPSMNNIKLEVSSQARAVEISGHAGNVQLKGTFTGTNLKELISDHEVVSLDKRLESMSSLFGGSAEANRLAQNARKGLAEGRTFLDISGDQIQLELPKDISNSKFIDVSFAKTRLPNDMTASRVEMRQVEFPVSRGNSVGTQSNFQDSTLIEVDLSGQRIQDANFANSTLDSVKLDKVVLSGNTNFDRAKINNLDANEATVERGTVSAIGTLWAKIKSWFGVKPQAKFVLNRGDFEGRVDFQNVDSSVLRSIDWSGVDFKPGSEIVFRDAATALDMTQKLVERGVSSIENVSITYADNAKKATLIKQGTTLEAAGKHVAEIRSQAATTAEEKAALDKLLNDSKAPVNRVVQATAELGDATDRWERLTAEADRQSKIVKKLGDEVSKEIKELREAVDGVRQAYDENIKEISDKLNDPQLSRKERRALNQELNDRRKLQELIENEWAQNPDAPFLGRDLTTKEFTLLDAAHKYLPTKGNEEYLVEGSEKVLDPIPLLETTETAVRHAEAEAKLHEMRQEVAKAKAEVDKAQTKLSEANKAHQEHYDRAADAHDQYTSAQDKYKDTLYKHNTELDVQLKDLPDTWRELLLDQVSDMSPENRARVFEQVMSEVSGQLSALNTELNNVGQSEMETDVNVKQAHLELESIKNRIESANKDIDAGTKRIEQLEASLAAREKSFQTAQEDLQKRADALEEEFKQTKDESKVSSELRELQKRMNQNEKTIEKSRELIRAEINDEKLEREIRQNDLKKTREAYEQAQTDVRHAESAHNKAAETLKATQSKIDAISKTESALEAKKAAYVGSEPNTAAELAKKQQSLIKETANRLAETKNKTALEAANRAAEAMRRETNRQQQELRAEIARRIEATRRR